MGSDEGERGGRRAAFGNIPHTHRRIIVVASWSSHHRGSSWVIVGHHGTAMGPDVQLIAQGVLSGAAEAEAVRTKYFEKLDEHTNAAKAYIPQATHLQGRARGFEDHTKGLCVGRS